MQPELEQASIETEQVMAKLAVDQKEADETQKIVATEEVIASKAEAEAKELQNKALNAVAAANKVLD